MPDNWQHNKRYFNKATGKYTFDQVPKSKGSALSSRQYNAERQQKASSGPNVSSTGSSQAISKWWWALLIFGVMSVIGLSIKDDSTRAPTQNDYRNSGTSTSCESVARQSSSATGADYYDELLACRQVGKMFED